ncbi:hypothetical protein [Nostoc sp.]
MPQALRHTARSKIPKGLCQLLLVQRSHPDRNCLALSLVYIISDTLPQMR